MPELLSTLLSEAAASRPEHSAVEDARGASCYAELTDQVGRLAATLSQFVRPGDRVGVMMPKSNDAVLSLYGIMWSGAAYVPLDVAAPTPRLTYMIHNCTMKALVTCTGQARRLIGQLGESDLQGMVLLDAEIVPDDLASAFSFPVLARPEVASQAPSRQPIQVAGDDLAYILYTSGSTGEPKGVMISHRNALAFIEWSRRVVDVRPDDRISSHAPFHFDLSILDLYVASLSRATLVLVPEQVSVFPATLAEWIEKERISVWYSVPSILVLLMDRGRIDRFTYPRLRKMIFAGEVFATKYLQAWMRKLRAADWFNLYGPTETNVCTYYRVSAPPVGDAPVSIGRAASGDTIYLRTEDGMVIDKPGVEGEIWVDGPTVALGYWGDAAKTAERFVVDPDLGTGDRRLYRTGDLACWDENGNLTFRGRRDHMIKSRGYRIELGEIESAAYTHPEIREACVVAVPDQQIGNRIRACLVRQPGAELDREAFELYLSRRLPRYMLPQDVFFLDALPKTSTGKIDRMVLANPEFSGA